MLLKLTNCHQTLATLAGDAHMRHIFHIILTTEHLMCYRDRMCAPTLPFFVFIFIFRDSA